MAQNELGGGSRHTPFAIKEPVKTIQKDMDIDIFRPVDLDQIPGGRDSIQILVRDALAKELVGLEDLKRLSINDGQLYLDGERFIQSKEIFTD